MENLKKEVFKNSSTFIMLPKKYLNNDEVKELYANKNETIKIKVINQIIDSFSESDLVTQGFSFMIGIQEVIKLNGVYVHLQDIFKNLKKEFVIQKCKIYYYKTRGCIMVEFENHILILTTLEMVIED